MCRLRSSGMLSIEQPSAACGKAAGAESEPRRRNGGAALYGLTPAVVRMEENRCATTRQDRLFSSCD